MAVPTWDEYLAEYGEKPPAGTQLRCSYEHCGKTYTMPKAVATKQFCSKRCKDASRNSGEHMLYDVVCPICGKQWQSPHRRYRFCSDECRRENYARRLQVRKLSLTPEEEIEKRNRERYERQIREGVGRTAIIAQLVEEYVERFPASAIKPQPYPHRSKRTAETMVVCRGDLHPGLATPSYNLDVFHRRMRQFTDRVLRIAEIISETIPIERLVVLDLGDNITGQGIFPNQAWSTEKHVMAQIYTEAAPAILEQNLAWCEHFPRVEEHSVPGNHGRTGKEYPEEVNWDNVLAQEIAARMENIKNHQIHVSWHWWKYVDLYCWRFLILHGNQVRSWLNIPFYGLVNKGMRWQGSMPDRWHYLVHGHFHVAFNFPWNDFEIISNGSLVSDDEFALRELGMASAPTQQVFGVHPEHGVTWRYTLRFD